MACHGPALLDKAARIFRPPPAHPFSGTQMTIVWSWHVAWSGAVVGWMSGFRPG
jgi:hypothetical protein